MTIDHRLIGKQQLKRPLDVVDRRRHRGNIEPQSVLCGGRVTAAQNSVIDCGL